MLFKDIDRLLAIEKHGSFSKAADELYISRSALTQQMKQLEKELGFVIFERDHKGACLTKEGAYFIKEMQNIKNSYEETIRYCCQTQYMIKDTLVIGMMPNLKSPFLSCVCKEFCRQYPRGEIKFKDFFPEDSEKKFKAKEFDISAEYFYNYIHDIKGLKANPIAVTKHSIQVVPDHPLAKKDAIGFEDLRGHKLIMYRRGIAKSEDYLRDYILHNEPEITIIDIDNYDSSLFTKCELDDAVLLAYALYEQSFSQFVHIPAKWNIPIHLGFYYQSDCRPVVSNFIQVAETVLETNKFQSNLSDSNVLL